MIDVIIKCGNKEVWDGELSCLPNTGHRITLPGHERKFFVEEVLHRIDDQEREVQVVYIFVKRI